MSEVTRVTTFYCFFSMTSKQVSELQPQLKVFADKIRGLIITGSEGINGTVAGSPEEISKFQGWLSEHLKTTGVDKILFKDSDSNFNPFRLFKVKVRNEIVTLGDTNIVPKSEMDSSHLSPEEWDQMLEREDVVCIDTRNWYETEVGMFRGALDPEIGDFKEFPEFLKNSGIPKDKKILMYCTGGIRCEKASIDARQQGYSQVYQLEGGVLNYFEKRKQGNWEGECFVFDNRVALKSDLKPSEKFRLCPHCGQPGQMQIECLRCDAPAIVCEPCLEKSQTFTACSKNCEYQLRLHPDRKGKKQKQGFRVALEMSKD